MKKNYNGIKDHIQSGSNITFCARSRSLNFRYYKILLLLLFLTIFIIDAEASHYRYGNLTWRVISGRTVEFTLTTSWASTSIGSGWVNTGDGYRAMEIANNITSNVNGVATRTQVFKHTYSSDGPFVASFSSCCRIFGLVNGSSASWNVTSTVDLRNGNENSPVSSLPAIVNVPVGSSGATFQVPANDLDGDALAYRLATSSELYISSLPPGLSINSQTGEVTINTSLSNYESGQLWVAGVIISDGKATTMVDFLISIKQPSTPPSFLYPPTPADGTVIQASPGQNINFDVSVNDADAGDQVTRLFVTGVPSGATFATASGNPATSIFNWTPTSSDFGSKVLNFIAEDNAGVQSSSSVTIQVSLKPRFDIPPSPATGDQIIIEPGQPINYTVQASDPDPDDVVQIISVEGKDMNGDKIPLYAGSSFSPLPSPAGNPTSGTFSWTPQPSDWGYRHVFFTAEDSYGDKTIHEVSQLVNTTPVFTSAPVTEINIGQTYTYNIQVDDPDIAFGDAVQLYGLNLPSWLNFTDQGGGAGVLTGTPSFSDVGDYLIEIEAQDINHHLNVGGIPRQSFTLTVNPCSIELAVEHTNAFCEGGNGTIDLTVTGANGVPSISWAGPDGYSASTEDLTELSEGEYIATVSDEFGCTESVTVNVGHDTDNVKPTVVTQDITVQLDAAGVASITAADINNASSDNCAIAADGYSLDISSFGCADIGPNIVTLTVTDVNGNSKAETATVTVEDKVAPVAKVKDVTVQLDETGSATITAEEINDNSSDNCAVASLSLDKTAFRCEDLGANTVTLTVLDQSGNQSTATATVIVEDNIFPEITAPKGVMVSNDPGECGAVVILGNAVASDNCAVTVTNDAPADMVFPVGTTQVTWTAMDEAGNTAIATQSVTVKDQESPSIAAMADIMVANDSGECGAVVAYDLPAFADNCASAMLAQTDGTGLSSGSLFPVGTTTLSYTATDAAGNTASMSFDVVVRDAEGPQVSTQNLTLALDASGAASVITEDVDDGSYDNCGIASLTLDRTSFGCADIGENTVTLTVADIHGNSNTATATITVEDNIAPSLTAPAAITVENDAGLCGAVVALGEAVASDNCTVGSLSNDAPAVFPVGTTTVTWTATDVNGNSSTATQAVTVTNEVPVISSIAAPLDPQEINSSFNMSGSFSDNNLAAVSWDWGDGTTSEGTIGTAEVAGSHSYSMPGVYTITCYVEDACGETASLIYQYVVVYDPNGGFVTGGGWINSPAGAYVNDLSAEGKANFGFVAKYKKGTNVPDGNTEFKFKAGNLDFRSTAYEWLVIAGHKAMYKGTGTINGSGSYGFQLSAVDGALKGSGEPDRIRMKIWDSNGVVVYDNQMGDADDAEAVMALGGGSIVIHDGGKKGSSNSRLAVSDMGEGVIAGFNAYPNPISEGGLWLEFPGREQEAAVQAYIYDLSGKVLIEKAFVIEKEGGKHLWEIDHGNWAGGIYLLVIRGDGVPQQMRLMK